MPAIANLLAPAPARLAGIGCLIPPLLERSHNRSPDGQLPFVVLTSCRSRPNVAFTTLAAFICGRLTGAEQRENTQFLSR
jgi:hypothetical protein